MGIEIWDGGLVNLHEAKLSTVGSWSKAVFSFSMGSENRYMVLASPIKLLTVSREPWTLLVSVTQYLL